MRKPFLSHPKKRVKQYSVLWGKGDTLSPLFQGELGERRPSFRNEASLFSNALFPVHSVVLTRVSCYLGPTLAESIGVFYSAVRLYDPTYTESEAILFSGSFLAGWRCISNVFANLYWVSRDKWLLSQLSVLKRITNKSSPADLRESKRLLEQELTSLHRIPPPLLAIYLKTGTTTEFLHVIVEFALRQENAPISAATFFTLVNGLLDNDLFYRKRSFVAMHELLMSVITSFAHQDGPIGELFSFGWVSLTKRWSRAYTKAGEGFLFYQSFRHLTECGKGIESRLPCVFYVNLIGSLVDCCSNSDDSHSSEGWEHITTVAKEAITLFGHDEKDLRSVWVILLKAALTIHPLRSSTTRVLESYHLCAELDHPVKVEKNSFLQVTRLLSASLADTENLDAVSELVQRYATFLRENDTISFLWMLDAIGIVLGDLWKHFQMSAQGEARFLLDEMSKLLVQRRVSGVSLDKNPSISKYREHFQLGEEISFWWSCGCGFSSPSSTTRCLHCIRHQNASWTCRECGVHHYDACLSQKCTCGAMNPREKVVVSLNLRTCPSCGCVLEGDSSACPSCDAGNDSETLHNDMKCHNCLAPIQGNYLYCSKCFTPVNPINLFLWHCASCQFLNHSKRVTCLNCKQRKRENCLCLPFNTWQCGCGASCSPFRRTCGSCSHDATYTCSSCKGVSGLQHTFKLPDYGLEICLCESCESIHPLDQIVLNSSSLPRHCLYCGIDVSPSHRTETFLFHCGFRQHINENFVFRCRRCDFKDLQIGYHCRKCRGPRPEVTPELDSFVWRCLRENEEEGTCGEWNYSWQSHCFKCGRGRLLSRFECRARSEPWNCSVCSHQNTALQVVRCECCSAVHPISRCNICGVAHLTYDCIPSLDPIN